ncbi:uncharacterized protein BYT42DRAFT_238219 [Radiomyces spectabilis]|uniref:uncharacterized protein n=1 Tax=Radiomyces spectabilis TaxID=64574 RepID=UPI00221EFE1C|nr:uncharacterized protein BYT42DRAFT_238219 [Radiomyces spectabilis]KAI8388526.1 hypothetical protein BYT42DRAFT_238219 [Radiomyces spectabilis]
MTVATVSDSSVEKTQRQEHVAAHADDATVRLLHHSHHHHNNGHSDSNEPDDDDWDYAPTAPIEYAQLDIDDSEITPLSLQHRQRQDHRDEDNDQDDLKTYRLPSDGGTIFASFLNMANSIIGAGIIGLPFSFKEAAFFY